MRNRPLIFGCIVLTGIALTTSVRADFDRGLYAFERDDYATALDEWRPLAEQGHARSQFFVGTMYDFGYGVAQDYVEAVKWYRRAASQGYMKALYNLAIMYEEGQGVPQDYVRAHAYYDILAVQGVRVGQHNKDILAKRMTPAQITEARRMTRECAEMDYKGCEF
jgi:TPR repeat protein